MRTKPAWQLLDKEMPNRSGVFKLKPDCKRYAFSNDICRDFLSRTRTGLTRIMKKSRYSLKKEQRKHKAISVIPD